VLQIRSLRPMLVTHPKMMRHAAAICTSRDIYGCWPEQASRHPRPFVPGRLRAPQTARGSSWRNAVGDHGRQPLRGDRKVCVPGGSAPGVETPGAVAMGWSGESTSLHELEDMFSVLCDPAERR
jgi:hypothetical protein